MISEKIIRQVEGQLSVSIVSWTPIVSGHINELFLLDSGQNKYVLKKYNSILPREKILPSIYIQKYLAAKGISPRVIFYNTDTPAFMLQEYIKFKDIQSLSLCGELLGKMHLHLAEYRGLLPSTYIPNDEILTVSENRLTEGQRELLRLKHLLSYKTAKLPELNRQVIHGDYHSGNLLHGDTDYVIDFDESKIYFRVYDVVKVLVGLVRQYGYRRASKDIKDFLTGYEKYIKLSYEEWLCMPDVYLYTLSRDVAGLNKGRYDFSEAYLKERIQLHAFLYREYEGFRDFIRSLYF